MMARKPVLVLLLAAMISVTLGGCWSASEIQQVNYAKAVGMDFKDGEYHVYVQSLNFASVAKSDSPSISQPIPVWVGHAKGRTLQLALSELFRTSQLRIAFGHVTALIVTEGILKSHIKDVIEVVNRFPESRYTTWVYGTRAPLEQLLGTTSLFRLSPLDSILHNPLPSYRQDSFFPPVLALQFIANLNEEASSAYLPSLALNDSMWAESNRPQQQLFIIEGAFFDRDGNMGAYFPRSKLTGYPWMHEETRRLQLLLQKDGVDYGSISVGDPRIRIKPVVRGDEVRFRIRAKYFGAMYEYLEPMTYEKMTGIAEELLKEQIMTTFRNGVQGGVDIFGLGETLYRKHPALWKRLSDNGRKTIVNEHSIESLEVELEVPYNGKYKRRI